MSDAIERLRDRWTIAVSYGFGELNGFSTEDACAIIAEFDALKAELMEQARCNGEGSEREARLIAERDGARRLCKDWHDYLTGPDEMGDYIRERRLRERLAAVAEEGSPRTVAVHPAPVGYNLYRVAEDAGEIKAGDLVMMTEDGAMKPPQETI